MKKALLAPLLLVAAGLQGQYTTQQKTYMQPLKLTPSLSLSVSPSPAIVNKTVTLSGSLKDYYITSTWPVPQYGFYVRNSSQTELFRRDFSTSGNASWTPTQTGTYTLVGAAKTFKGDGSVEKVYDALLSFEVKPDNRLTWISPITAQNLGSTPASHLANKKISEIVNSVVSGRTDNQKCNECHKPPATATISYQPPSTTITPSTSIARGNGTSYRWNQSGSSGIIERFCATTNPPKPADLCAVFRKWASDGYLSQ